jgi:hypothetical protein
MGTNICDTIDTGIGVYNFPWWNNIWVETREWNVSSYIYKYNIVFACIIRKDSRGGISSGELCWTSHNHIIILFFSSWDCLCPGEQVYIAFQNTYKFICVCYFLSSEYLCGFRKLREKYHWTMLLDTAAELEGPNVLHIYLSRFGFLLHIWIDFVCLLLQQLQLGNCQLFQSFNSIS